MITKTLEWKALELHRTQIKNKPLKEFFFENPRRFKHFSLSAAGISLDYSNNHCDTDTMSLLYQLAHRLELPRAIQDLFHCEVVNRSEKRPALHTALRDLQSENISVAGENIIPAIQTVQQRMGDIVEKIRQGNYLGYSGKAIRRIINIGIGGSDLGPKMLTYALHAFSHPELRFHFVSNLDRRHLDECLQDADPETTLFIVSSKTFTTHETLSNLRIAKQWVQQAAGQKNSAAHFIE